MLKYNILAIANKLNIKELEKKSLKSFLEKESLNLKTEFLMLSFKYGLKNIKGFEKAVKEGKIKETEETRDDFFRLDYLENRIKIVESFLKDF
ncbi:hypothetical protein KKB43_03470 [Patescibacteria group bacterium]|nr:hypothetical protein [Patescibacteria group bacterium]MBU4580050.1 hypothetical protein [Patescibacteria group bacterium]